MGPEYKELWVQKSVGPKQFQVKNIWVLNNLESKKNLESKHNFGPNTFFVQRKDFGREKNFGHKNSLDLKEFWLQGKLLSKNFGEEKLSPGQMLQGQMSL